MLNYLREIKIIGITSVKYTYLQKIILAKNYKLKMSMIIGKNMSKELGLEYRAFLTRLTGLHWFAGNESIHFLGKDQEKSWNKNTKTIHNLKECYFNCQTILRPCEKEKMWEKSVNLS